MAYAPFGLRNTLWGNSFLAKRTAEVLVRIGLVTTVTVGDMAALSHLTDRDMGNVYDVGNILDHVNAAFTLPCAADVIVEPIGILLIK